MAEALATVDRAKILGFVFNAADPSMTGYPAHYYRAHSLDRSSSNGHPGGVLKRTAGRVGDSLWRHRQPSEPARSRWRGDPR